MSRARTRAPRRRQPPVRVPGFWDPRRRPERPDLSRMSVIRFLTETDYPPFNFAGPDGNPQGFNVDLARMHVRGAQARLHHSDAPLRDAHSGAQRQSGRCRDRFDRDDAGHAHAGSISPIPYYRTPARFVARRDLPIDDVRCRSGSRARRSRVVAGTAHEAYLQDSVHRSRASRLSECRRGAAGALRRGDVDLLFGDAISLAFWLNGTDSENCCAFRGGPYMDSRYFGEGIGIAVKKGNDTMRLALNWALFRVWEQGRFTDLWLRYFPISPF